MLNKPTHGADLYWSVNPPQVRQSDKKGFKVLTPVDDLINILRMKHIAMAK
jgi:hypothetical protein